MKRTCLLILGLCAAAAATAATAAGAGTALPAERVVLRDGTTFDHAVLVRLTPATFVVQTADALYELSEDEIDAATLRAMDFTGDRPPLVTHHYDEIHADGTVTVHWSLPLRNDGRKAVTEMRLGLAPWEREFAPARTYVDERGMPLIPVFDPPLDRWVAARTSRSGRSSAWRCPWRPAKARRSPGGRPSPGRARRPRDMVFTHPAITRRNAWSGARCGCRRAPGSCGSPPNPAPASVSDGCEYLMWRRYYQAGERFDLEVVYTLD